MYTLAPMSSRNKLEESRADYTSLEEILPENARRYYRKPTENFSIESIKHKSTPGRKLIRRIGLGLVYPLFNLHYLAANELLVVLENGEHRIIGGPGVKWVVGLNDKVLGKYTIGEDINQGPIKLLYVPARQGMQDDAEVLPEDGLYVPAGQRMHDNSERLLEEGL